MTLPRNTQRLTMKPLNPLEVLDNFAQTACAYRMAYAAVRRRQRAIFKAARAKLGVRQVKLAATLGISGPQLCRYETSAKRAGPAVLVKLAGLMPMEET